LRGIGVPPGPDSIGGTFRTRRKHVQQLARDCTPFGVRQVCLVSLGERLERAQSPRPPLLQAHRSCTGECSQGSYPVRASTPQAPWPAVGSSAVRRRAPAIPGPFVYDVFWLLSFGLYVSAPARRAPVPQAPPGPAVREMSLRRSCVAYFLREFPGPCPRVDRPPSATAPQAPPAAKKQL
jgi:hypothetical protein